MRFGHGELHLVILALLSQQPMHGYELMNELSTRLGRRYNASPGSIYPAVAALEAEGLVTGSEESDRRIYELTKDGTEALLQRGARLAALEGRLGVRFRQGIEPELARFSERVRAAAPLMQDEVLAGALDVAATEIERLANEGGIA